jgi:hypothetical protein
MALCSTIASLNERTIGNSHCRVLNGSFQGRRIGSRVRSINTPVMSVNFRNSGYEKITTPCLKETAGSSSLTSISRGADRHASQQRWKGRRGPPLRGFPEGRITPDHSPTRRKRRPLRSAFGRVSQGKRGRRLRCGCCNAWPSLIRCRGSWSRSV